MDITVMEGVGCSGKHEVYRREVRCLIALTCKAVLLVVGFC